MGLSDEVPGAVVGSILANKYRVERELANGGQGVVVLARHLRLPQLVAIKLPRYLGRLSAEASARMFREARAAFRIHSQHVAKVFDVEVLDGMPFIVMEYLVGADFARVIAERGAMPIEEAIGFVLQACEALAEAHQLGIVHRDVKPSNLFLATQRDAPPMVKVLDFGLAKALESVSDDGSFRYSTEPLRVMGSARYMSPEQASGAAIVDARTDVWSIGAILYELLSGVPAFQASTRSQSLAKVLTQDPPPLLSLRPEMPALIDAAVRRCLHKAPEDRFQTVHDLVVALAPYAPDWARPNIDRVLGRHRGDLVDDAAWSVGADRPLDSQLTTRIARPRPRLALLAVAGCALVLGALVYPIARRHRSTQAASAALESPAPPLRIARAPAPVVEPEVPAAQVRPPAPLERPALVSGAARRTEHAERAPAAVFRRRKSVTHGPARPPAPPPAPDAAPGKDLGGRALFVVDPLEGRR